MTARGQPRDAHEAGGETGPGGGGGDRTPESKATADESAERVLIERTVRAAPTEVVIAALIGTDPLAAVEVDEESGRVMFHCPVCQASRKRRWSSGPAAFGDQLSWSCPCGAHGTRWSLESSLLGDVAAIHRLLAAEEVLT